MTKSEIKLPDTLSGLIRLALDDLHKCEKDDKYRIYMEDWHVPKESGVCDVCLAGAVMAKTLNVPIDCHIKPFELKVNVNKQLTIINDLRSGQVSDALREINPENRNPTEKYDREIEQYEDNPELFHKQMNQLADDLEKAGL